jgi:hypothetical protein
MVLITKIGKKQADKQSMLLKFEKLGLHLFFCEIFFLVL